jgi:hypothetical protein
MDEVIEIMARADVDYFWRDPGKRLEGFEKPIADGVRSRMRAIHEALAVSGFTICKAARNSDNSAPGGSGNSAAGGSNIRAGGSDIYEARLLEIGRITTTWAKFEHWIDQPLRSVPFPPSSVHCCL